MIPIVTLVGTDFGYMLTGSMLIEKVFSIPGIGKLAVDAMSNRDLPLLEGTVMYIAFVFVIVNLIVDVSYAFLDSANSLRERSSIRDGKKNTWIF